MTPSSAFFLFFTRPRGPISWRQAPIALFVLLLGSACMKSNAGLPAADDHYAPLAQTPTGSSSDPSRLPVQEVLDANHAKSSPSLDPTQEEHSKKDSPIKKAELLPPHQALDDPSGVALKHFFDRLEGIDHGRSGETVKVLHLGDSTIGLDGIPSSIRDGIQSRFGDGGPGFILMDRYMKNYKPRNVQLRSNHRWKHCYITHRCRKHGHYGLGGVLFESTGGASSRFSTLEAGKRAQEVEGIEGSAQEISHIELWYADSPRGGRISVSIDDGEAEIIDTRGDRLEDRFKVWDVPLGPHTVKVRSVGHGKSLLYGVVLEKKKAGITWESISMLGAFTKRLLNWDPEHISRQIQQRSPDLIMLTFGGNDLRRMVAAGLGPERYREELRQVVQRLRAGAPEASCLIMGIVDHGKSGQCIVPPETVKTMVEAQKAEALAQGCAFFNTYEAMGGKNSIKKWRKTSPPLSSPDLKHLNRRGQKLMGKHIQEAIVYAYDMHRQKS